MHVSLIVYSWFETIDSSEFLLSQGITAPKQIFGSKGFFTL